MEHQVCSSNFSLQRRLGTFLFSLTLKALRAGGKLLHFCTREPRYKAASILRMYNKMITMRLLWVLDNVEGLREAAERNEVSSRKLESY